MERLSAEYMMKKKDVLKAAVISSILIFGICSAAYADNEENGVATFVLDPLVVVGSRIPETITESKADVSVVSRKEIEDMHMESVEEALRTVPGVQFLNYGANGINANLSGVRINGSKDIVVLVDGVRVTDFLGANNSGYMYASLLNNMDNIERVEILRGAAGTIYGSGAKGGVINIVTRNIKETKSTIDISKGSFGKKDYKFNTQGKNGKTGYRVYYGKSSIGDTKDGAGKTWEGRTDSNNAGVKFIYEFAPDNKLTVSYDRIKTDYSGTDYIYHNIFSGDYKSNTFTLNYDYKISDKWNNRFTYRRNTVSSHYGQNVNNYAVNSDYTYTFISDQVNYKTSRNNLIFGLDYSKGYNNDLRTVGYDDNGNIVWGHHNLKNYSYYIQDDWEFIPKVTLSGGIRYDKPQSASYAPAYDTHTAKSYKLSWDITDNDSIYAGRSDFYILPTMDQLYQDKFGNAKLAPAYGRTSSIGYNKKFDDFNILTFNWFKTESEKTIGYDGKGQYQNYDNAVSRGWNAQYMTQFADHWNANAGWAHLYHDAQGDNYSMGYYPKDMLTFGVYYNYAKVNAGLDGFYFMRKINPIYADKQGWPADNYGVYNLSVNYSPEKNMTFYVKIDNIFDKLWAEHTNVIHLGGKPGTWYSMPGRSFNVGMQLNF